MLTVQALNASKVTKVLNGEKCKSILSVSLVSPSPTLSIAQRSCLQLIAHWRVI